MSVKVRPYRNGGFEVDILWRAPDGRRQRERKRLTVTSKSAARRWGEQRQQALLLHGPATTQKEVPTLRAFADRFIEGYAQANRQKPSGIAAKETILKVHLIPIFGSTKLDALTNEDVQQLKVRLGAKAPKTVNNVLAVLSVLLKKAVEWDVIERVPCTIRLVQAPKPSVGFHDFDAYERLVAAAKATDARTYLITLLGGEAGLRCGEMIALEWRDVDLGKQQVCVQRSAWNGQVTIPKGGRLRYVSLTTRLVAAFRDHRHLRGPNVLCQDGGQPLTRQMVQYRVRRAARRAHLSQGGVHILRHTFCSRLAMRGASPSAIQKLAGHQDLVTTQRYMHLSQRALSDAVRLLEPSSPCGDIVETGRVSEGKSNG